MYNFVKRVGWPKLIITLFLIILFIIGIFVGVDSGRTFMDIINRFGMNAVLVLSMVPMIQSGSGLNFGLPVGLIGGMLGAVLSVELNLTGIPGALAAVLMGMFFGGIFGFFYSLILNRVKGDEMIIATYVGFSFVALMNIFWVLLPFRNPILVMGYKGEGLRTTISLAENWDKAFSNICRIPIGPQDDPLQALGIPTGMFLVFAIFAYMIWTFFRTKRGTAMTAVGSNPIYAKAGGIDINKERTLSIILSSALAGAGMVIYEQGYGFIQMYNAALAFSFPSVAAILLGGASVKKASIMNVLIGTFLFQAILTLTPTVINTAIQVDISEVLRLIIQNGLIVYALTRKGEESGR